jgi:rhodanese-related sulfurtransferase
MSLAACWNSAPMPICPRTPNFSKDEDVILYCASAGRAALAGKMLKDLGYERVYNFGGFKEWADSGGAIER